MKFRIESGFVREAQRQNLWELAQQEQLAQAQQQRALDSLNQQQVEWDRTRHDGKNWVGTAKRLLQSDQPAGAASCLEALGVWLDVRPQRSAHSLHARLHNMLPGWQIHCRTGVTLCLRISPSVDSHSAHNDLVVSLVDNLFRNALTATWRGGVRGQIWQEPDQLVLSVADTGVGFGQSEGDGWGLALSVLKQQVASLGGRWRTEHCGGVCQRIWLPRQTL